jgi:hypothetical protein
MSTITSLPPAPSRADPANFATKGDALLGALDQFVTETNTVASEVITNRDTSITKAAEALDSANLAALSESNAAASAAAAASLTASLPWFSGTTYAYGATVWSPITRVIYRRIIAGAGTTDPSADNTNWGITATQGLVVIDVVTSTVAMSANGHYIFRPVSGSPTTPIVGSLPPNPINGDMLWITVANSLFTNSIARNTKTIMDLSEDMTIDSDIVTLQLRYVNTTWRII